MNGNIIEAYMPFMNMKYRFYLVFLIALVFSCTSDDLKEIEIAYINDIELRFQDGVLASGLFKKVVVNEQHDLLSVNDVITNQIYVFNVDGNHRSTIGKAGRGPGELVSIFGYNFDYADPDSINLVIYDQGQDLLNIYSDQGSFLQTMNGIRDKGFYPASDDLYFSKGFIYMPVVEAIHHPNSPWESPVLLKLDTDGSIVKKIGNYNKCISDTGYYSYSPLVSMNFERGEFYVAYESLNIIEKFNLETGEIIKSTVIKSDSFKMLASREFPEIGNPAQSYDILTRMSLPRLLVHSDDYIVLYFSNTIHHSDDDFFVSIIDMDTFNYLGTVKTDRPLRGALSNNRLLFEYDNDPDKFLFKVYAVN